MSTTLAPTVATTKDFIVIKLPRRMFTGGFVHRKLSLLERDLAESLREVQQGKLHGPFSNAADFLSALKKPLK